MEKEMNHHSRWPRGEDTWYDTTIACNEWWCLHWLVIISIQTSHSLLRKHWMSQLHARSWQIWKESVGLYYKEECLVPRPRTVWRQCLQLPLSPRRKLLISSWEFEKNVRTLGEISFCFAKIGLHWLEWIQRGRLFFIKFSGIVLTWCPTIQVEALYLGQRNPFNNQKPKEFIGRPMLGGKMGLNESWILGGRLGISLGEVATEYDTGLALKFRAVVKRFRWQATLAHSFSAWINWSNPFCPSALWLNRN